MYNLQSAKNILIAHMAGMGDNVLSIPLLHNIRTSLQNAKLDMLIPRGRSDIFHNQKLDRVFEHAGPFFPQQVLDMTYDVVFDLSAGSNPSAHLYHLKFDRLLCFKKYLSFKNEIGLPWCPNVLVWQQMLNLLTLTDVKPPYRLDYGLHVSEANCKFARFIKEGIGSEHLICIVPDVGESTAGKKWSTQRLVQLIDYLHEVFPCEIVLVGHYKRRKLGEQIKDRLSCNITNLMGLTSLGALAGLLRKTKLVISGDTGTMHLAGILNTPLIALFGPTNPNEYGPLGNNHKLIISETRGMNGISAEQVMDVCYEMLTELN